jgi:hypothetical protein
MVVDINGGNEGVVLHTAFECQTQGADREGNMSGSIDGRDPIEVLGGPKIAVANDAPLAAIAWVKNTRRFVAKIFRPFECSFFGSNAILGRRENFECPGVPISELLNHFVRIKGQHTPVLEVVSLNVVRR